MRLVIFASLAGDLCLALFLGDTVSLGLGGLLLCQVLAIGCGLLSYNSASLCCFGVGFSALLGLHCALFCQLGIQLGLLLALAGFGCSALGVFAVTAGAGLFLFAGFAGCLFGDKAIALLLLADGCLGLQAGQLGGGFLFTLQALHGVTQHGEGCLVGCLGFFAQLRPEVVQLELLFDLEQRNAHRIACGEFRCAAGRDASQHGKDCVLLRLSGLQRRKHGRFQIVESLDALAGICFQDLRNCLDGSQVIADRLVDGGLAACHLGSQGLDVGAAFRRLNVRHLGGDFGLDLLVKRFQRRGCEVRRDAGKVCLAGVGWWQGDQFAVGGHGVLLWLAPARADWHRGRIHRQGFNARGIA